MTIKARYEGAVFVPTEAVTLPQGQVVEVQVPDSVQLGQTVGGCLVVGHGATGSEIAAALRESKPIWQDVGDSSTFARQLREEAQRPRYQIDPD